MQIFAKTFLILSLAVFAGSIGSAQGPESKTLSFIITSDMREFTVGKEPELDYFAGACQAIRKVGPGEFMISPGDIDPPQHVRTILDRYLGSNYTWYPVVGNHEAETPADMEWLRSWGSNDIPGLVRRGPPGCETTTFSFDRGPVHFAVVNQYFDGKTDYRSKGKVVDGLYDWLKADLEATRQPVIIVVGHEPIQPLPDMDNGRLRHEKDCLNAYPENSRRFHKLLVDHKVAAYLCAHTHNLSIANLDGLWQVDSGHARGKGDTGAPSTFLKMRVNATETVVDCYRQLKPGEPYILTRSITLTPSAR